MPIGEFDGAAKLPGYSASLLATPMYWFYEMGPAALDPSRAFADATKLFFKNPANPFAHTQYGKSVAAAAELFERVTVKVSGLVPELPSLIETLLMLSVADGPLSVKPVVLNGTSEVPSPLPRSFQFEPTFPISGR